MGWYRLVWSGYPIPCHLIRLYYRHDFCGGVGSMLGVDKAGMREVLFE